VNTKNEGSSGAAEELMSNSFSPTQKKRLHSQPWLRSLDGSSI